MSESTKNKLIVLIYPKTGIDVGPTIAPPHSVLTVAAPLHNAGYRVRIIDQRVESDWEKELTSVLNEGPLCVGVSSMTGTQIYFALEISGFVKKHSPHIPVIWGGPHPSILPEQTLKNPNIDIVVVGEGELTFQELVKCLETGSPLKAVAGIGFKDKDNIMINAPRPMMDIETLLPIPWELVKVEAYIHPDMYLSESPRTMDIGQTSRGCPFNCGFCNSATLRQRKWRAMSVEKSLKIILDPVKKFNLSGIWIRDDEFYIKSDRVEKICQGIIASGVKMHWYTSGTRIDIFNKASDEIISLLKESGAYKLKFGAESGSNRILTLMCKNITVDDTIKTNLKAKEHGIAPVFALMIGFPTETFEDINKTIDLAFRLKKDNPKAQLETMTLYTALPGTPLYDLALKHGLKPPEKLEGWINWSFDEYDLEGERIPWFNRKEREMIGNISYMSVLSNGLLNLANALTNRYLRMIFRPLARFCGVIYRFRLSHKYYSFAPDLALLRFIRKNIFYKAHHIIK